MRQTKPVAQHSRETMHGRDQAPQTATIHLPQQALDEFEIELHVGPQQKSCGPRGQQSFDGIGVVNAALIRNPRDRAARQPHLGLGSFQVTPQPEKIVRHPAGQPSALAAERHWHANRRQKGHLARQALATRSRYLFAPPPRCNETTNESLEGAIRVSAPRITTYDSPSATRKERITQRRGSRSFATSDGVLHDTARSCATYFSSRRECVAPARRAVRAAGPAQTQDPLPASGKPT